MKQYRRIGLAVMSLMLGACAPAEDPAKELSDPTFTTFLTASSAAGLMPSEFAVGEPISFAAVTTNRTDQVQHVTWCNGSRIDIQVYDPDDNLVWNRYHGLAFTQATQPDSFGPGEERTTEAVWAQDRNEDNPTFAPTQVPPGYYYAIARGCAGQNGVSEGFTSPRVDFVIN